MVRPIEDKIINIGGVKYSASEVIMEQSGSREKNGVKMNTVFLKNGIHLTYPDQTNPEKHPHVDSGLIIESWPKKDSSYTNIYDIEGAVIFGHSNQHDEIDLSGKCSGNIVRVCDPGNITFGKIRRGDAVYIDSYAENNKVEMDSRDKLTIDYLTGQGIYEQVKVQGEGLKDQEDELYDRTNYRKYAEHKRFQKEPANWWEKPVL